MVRLYVVGIGPGEWNKITSEAMEVLNMCDVIAGYSVYIDLIRERLGEKEYIVSGMRQERLRCSLAIGAALEGKKTAVVCSGDACVYGMAGLLMELGAEYDELEIQVIPGVTAALSGSAVLGAPLGHDFAVISLSDLMTPWDSIELKIKCAAMADMVICFYNPSSKKRQDYLKKACDIILEYRSGSTVCGYVKNIGRQGQCSKILSLEELRDTQADMFTTVFVGSSQSKVIKGQMVTPRGYEV